MYETVGAHRQKKKSQAKKQAALIVYGNPSLVSVEPEKKKSKSVSAGVANRKTCTPNANKLRNTNIERATLMDGGPSPAVAEPKNKKKTPFAHR